MDFKKQVFNLVQELSGTENHITVNKFYLKYTGDLQAGAFLSQLIYWADKSSRKDGFFYKTYEEWQNELFMSEYSIRKTTKELKKLGFLETKLIKANGAPTLHYKIDKLKFLEEIMRFLAEEKEAAAKENELQDGTEIDKKTAETVENSGICENAEWNLRNQRMESAKSKNGICEIEETLTSVTTSVTTSDTTNNKNNSMLSSSSSKKESKKSTYNPLFEEFWKQYPKKINKKKASVSFEEALKNNEFDSIMNGLKKYINHLERNGTESKYILHAATFLNGERFIDEFEEKSFTKKRVNDPDDYGPEYFDNQNQPNKVESDFPF